MRLPEPPTLEQLSQRFGAGHRWIVLSVVGIGICAGLLEASAFNVAMPALARDFHLGQGLAQWAMTGFMAAMALAMLPAPWLLERAGFRRVFLGAVLLLIISSLAGRFGAGLGFGFVVFVRVVQGIATGVLMPLGLLVLLRLFPVEVQGRASGLLTFGIAVTPAVAPAFGGMLIDRFGWPSIFILGLPFGLLAMVLGLLLLPRAQLSSSRRFDWFGASLLSAASVVLIIGVTGLPQLGPNAQLASLGIALVLALGYAWHARRAKSPLFGLDLFRDRNFAMGTLVSFTYGFGLFGSTYLIPVFMQDALHYSASAAGSALIPGGVALVLSTPVAGRLSDSYSPRHVIVSGLALFGISFAALAWLGGGISYAELIVTTVIGRIGLGLILPALNLGAVRSLRSDQMAQSTVVVSYMRQMGGVLGIAAVAVFVAWREDAYSARPDGVAMAYAQGFALLGVLVLAALVAATRMRDVGAIKSESRVWR